MNGKCAKCGRDRDGDRYQVYIAKATREGVNTTFSDLRTENVFLCRSCARSGKAGMYWALIIIFGLMGLPMLASAILAMGQGGPGAGVGGFLFGLLLMAPAAWGLYQLVTLKPTKENGEYAAAGVRFRELRAQGCTAIAAPELKKLIPTHPELMTEWLQMGMREIADVSPVVPANVTESDLQAIHEYMHFLAQQWWEAEGQDSAICERCNGQVPKGYGCLMGHSLYHAQCFNSLLEEGLPHLRRNPDWFLGRGVLEKAREFAASQQPTP